MPKFSVIIPSYNRSQTIRRAIHSVLDQSFSDFEIIVVDDGSTDNTSEILSQYPTAKYIFQTNQGVCAARNRGAKEAQGRWLVFLDSDDELLPQALKVFASFIDANTSNDLFKCGFITKNFAGNFIQNPARDGAYSPPIPGSFFLSKACFIKSGGYNVDITYSENTELFIRLSSIGIEPIVFDFMSMVYHESKSGGSKNLKNMDHSLELILKLHSDTMSNLENWNLYQTLGVIRLRRGRFSVARKTLLMAIRFRPLELFTYARFLIACFPILSRKIYKSHSFT